MAQPDDPVPAPDFAIFARELVKSAVKRVQVAYPARVLAYYPPDASTGDPALVDVQIARRYARPIDHAEDAKQGEDVRQDPEHGLLAVADMPPVPRVVVHYPGFAGMRLTGPVPVDEVGLLVTCTRSIDRWVRRGSDPVQDPVFPHAMNLKDSIFLPGLRAGADDGADVVPTDGWRLGDDANTWELKVEEGTSNLTLRTDGPTATVDGSVEVKVGANATAYAAKAAAVDGNFDAIKGTFAGIPAVGDPGSTAAAVNTLLTFFKSWQPTPTAAVKAKVE